jgi:integrase/recombinase XerC
MQKIYEAPLNHFGKWFAVTNGESLTYANLTATDVRDYLAHLKQKGFAISTINKRLVAIKAFISDGIESKAITHDPLKHSTKLAMTSQALAPKWLDKRETSALLRECEAEINSATTLRLKQLAERNYYVIILLLNTGLRISELLSLNTEHIELRERSGELTVRSGKGGKERTISLNQAARDALAHLTLPLGVSAPIVQRYLVERAIRAKLEDVTPHVLRHTFAKSLIDSGVSLEKVAALLGHSNINTTRIYTTPSQKDLQHAVETLDV